MRKRRLLIICRDQFGYHLPTYYYCKHGAARFEITYIGLDAGHPRLELPGVQAKYVFKSRAKIARYMGLIRSAARGSAPEQDVVLIKYFPGCAFIRLLNPSRHYILDIRTGSVAHNRVRRMLANMLIRFECCFFRHIAVISRSLAERLWLPTRRHIVPLGAEEIAASSTPPNGLHLLYVGTLNNRRLEDTIEGLDQFLKRVGDTVRVSYSIVGDGHRGQLTMLRAMVRDRGLCDVVQLPGYIHRERLAPYFHKCNVGVAYVPRTPFFDVQPVTKTFEYLFAGMPVIATDTLEHRRVINKDNGILVDDTPDGFCEGLMQFHRTRHRFDPEVVRDSCRDSSWHRIVQDNLVPYLESVIESATPFRPHAS